MMMTQRVVVYIVRVDEPGYTRYQTTLRNKATSSSSTKKGKIVVQDEEIEEEEYVNENGNEDSENGEEHYLSA